MPDPTQVLASVVSVKSMADGSRASLNPIMPVATQGRQSIASVKSLGDGSRGSMGHPLEERQASMRSLTGSRISLLQTRSNISFRRRAESISRYGLTIDFKPPYRMPIHVDMPIERHQGWLRMLKEAEDVVKTDEDFQTRAKGGLMIKGRAIPPETLGRMYAQYCHLINKFYDVYLNHYQMQRQPYMQEIISIIFKRIYELRKELVHFIVNDYIYVDAALIQLIKTPFDIEIVVPYHYPLEMRDHSMEQLLQKMWKAVEKRKARAVKELQNKKESISSRRGSQFLARESSPDDNSDEQPEIPSLRRRRFQVKSDDEDSIKSVSEDYYYLTMIQRHERFRQYYLNAIIARKEARLKYCDEPEIQKSVEQTVPSALMNRAAQFIQKIYRQYMQIKRENLLIHKRDVLLGLIPDSDKRPLSLKEASDKLYELRRNRRQKIDKSYKEAVQKKKTFFLKFKRGELIEDITQEVIEWFRYWYKGYGFFPQYPSVLDQGTVIVIRGDYPTIEEVEEADEKHKKKTRGKNKEMLKQEKEQEKYDAIARMELEEEKEKKAKEALFKARCNPMNDPGYKIKQSEVLPDVIETLRKYRQSWSIYDAFPTCCAEIVYGFMQHVIAEDIMAQIGLEAREIVDELMRLELKLFIKAQKKMFAKIDQPWPKPRRWIKPPKQPSSPKPFEFTKEMRQGFDKVFDLGIVTKPTNKLTDIVGDLKYAVYEDNLKDPDTKWPTPGYGDVRRRLILSCIYGSGIEPSATRNKAVLLLGMRNNGKSFLADCVAGELNAVKFDISPELFSANCRSPGKTLTRIFHAARVFQPSVIFCRNIERVFYKTVPPDEKKERAGSLKRPLARMINTMIPSSEKMIFIATCSDPFVAKARPMMNLFNTTILVPKPDYGSIRGYLYDSFQRIRSMPRDYCVQGLAQVLQGFGFGTIMGLVEAIMTPERIIKLSINPFRPEEFLEYLIENGMEPMTAADYKLLEEFHVKHSPLRKEREELLVINKKRKYVYDRLAQIAADRAKKKQKKAL